MTIALYVILWILVSILIDKLFYDFKIRLTGVPKFIYMLLTLPTTIVAYCLVKYLAYRITKNLSKLFQQALDEIAKQEAEKEDFSDED